LFPHRAFAAGDGAFGIAPSTADRASLTHSAAHISLTIS
jgi:hypothetical protein